MPPRPVTAALASSRSVPLYLQEIGTVSPKESVAIMAQVSGPILTADFTEGAEVKRGDLLFTIDPRPFDAAVERAAATVAADQAKLEFTESQFRRAEELKRTKVVAPEEYDSARSALDAARAQLQADEAALRTVRINREYCEIRSPIDGRAGKRLVDAGNVVTANVTGLVSIRRQDPIDVAFEVPESQFPKVRGFAATKTLDVDVEVPGTDLRRRGKVYFFDNTVKAGSGTVLVRAELPNVDRAFWPGQFVAVQLLLETLENAVLVPAESVKVGQKGPFVFVIREDSTVDLRPVRVGQKHGAEVVIESGVKAGEKVVVTGQLMIAPGARVAVVEEPSAAGGPGVPGATGEKK